MPVEDRLQLRTEPLQKPTHIRLAYTPVARKIRLVEVALEDALDDGTCSRMNTLHVTQEALHLGVGQCGIRRLRVRVSDLLIMICRLARADQRRLSAAQFLPLRVTRKVQRDSDHERSCLGVGAAIARANLAACSLDQQIAQHVLGRFPSEARDQYLEHALS